MTHQRKWVCAKLLWVCVYCSHQFANILCSQKSHLLSCSFVVAKTMKITHSISGTRLPWYTDWFSQNVWQQHKDTSVRAQDDSYVMLVILCLLSSIPLSLDWLWQEDFVAVWRWLAPRSDCLTIHPLSKLRTAVALFKSQYVCLVLPTH